MNLVSYLTEIYGYNNPIFIKDVRIGRKSKTAIRAEFSRLTKNGDLIRKSNGIYFIKGKEVFGNTISLENIIEKKFIYASNCPQGFEKMFIIGYYSGLTFLNILGVSQQVPATLEVTTNNTSSKKRLFVVGKRTAILRKGKTEITFQNYKILQFLDSFHWMSNDDIKKNKELLLNYIKDNAFSKSQFNEYIKLYGFETVKKLTESGLLDAFKKHQQK